MEREDLPSRLARQVLADRVVPALWEGEHQRWQDEEDPCKGCDPAGRVAHDRADREREDPDEHHVERAADHRARDARLRERDPEVVDAVDDRLAREEAHEHGGHHEHEREHRVVDELRPEHGQPLRHRGEGRADRAGRVLRADQEDAQHGDRELRDVERVAARALVGRHRAPVRASDEREDDREGDREQEAGGERPLGRSHRAELRPLREQDAIETEAACGVEPRQPDARRDHAHATASSAANSSSSRVRFMNASSSEACCGVNSWSAMPAPAAASPTCSAVSPCTSSAPRSASANETPGTASSVRSRSSSGERTNTTFCEARATKSSTLVSAISLPRPITIRWSAVSAISLMRWEETKTVRPSAASPFRRLRTQWMPSGSRPLTGSSSITVLGSPNSACAMPRRWPMPSENWPERLRATSCRPTRSMSSVTRRFGIPCVCASASRWLYAERPVWTERASRSAPTSYNGDGWSR